MESLTFKCIISLLIGFGVLHLFRKILGYKQISDMSMISFYSSISLGVVGMNILFRRDESVELVLAIGYFLVIFIVFLIISLFVKKKTLNN